MNHREALVDINGKMRNPNGCDGELVLKGTAFGGDVYWHIYQCKKCLKKVITVGGSPHWWNYEKEESPSNREGEF